MASTTHRMGKKGKQQPSHTGYRSGVGVSGGGRDYHNSHPTSASMPQSNLPGVYSNPDMAFALVNIVGCVVDVHMQSGTVYQGVLKAVSPKLSIALALAHDKSTELCRSNTEKLMQLEFADIVSVSVLPESNPNLNSKDIFKTDAEISRSNGPSLSRDLQPFSFEDESQSPLHIDEGASTSGGWSAEEMFEINRSKFNVESSYDEEMTEYTTKLDRADTKDYQEREERAAKLAMEIESNIGSQRYKKLEDGGTEEELFSAVVRYGSAFPPLPSSSSSSSSSPATAPKTGRGDPDQTKTESSSATPPMNGLVQRASVAASSQSSHTLQEPHHPPLSVTTSTSSLSSAAEPGGSQDTEPSFSYLAAVVNGRTSPTGAGTKTEDSVSSMEDSPGTTSGAEVTSSQGAGAAMEVMSQESTLSSVGGGATMVEEVGGVNGEMADKQGKEMLEAESARLSAAGVHSQLVQAEDQVPTVLGTPPTEGVAEGDGSDGKSDAIPVTTPTSESPPLIESKDADKKVKDFTLNPTAKEFNPKAAEFVPRSEVPPSSQSGSPIHHDTPSYRHISSHPPTSGVKPQRYTPKPHMRSGNYPQQEHGYASSPYMFNQASQQVPGMVRSPLHQGQGMQFSPQPFHPSYPLAANNFIHPQGIVNPSQVLTASNQKFYGDMVSGAVYPGQQQYPVPMPQHILQQQPPALTGPLLTSVSQPGLPTSHASLVGGAPAGGTMVFMQGTQHPGANPMYHQMMLPQVGNQATSTDMMGGQLQQYYQ